jgi:hypothetical protein
LRPWLTVGALAIAARRANAVGAVRITLGPVDVRPGDLAPPGLEIELVRVAGFAPGFAASGVAEPVTFRVPYTAVRGLVREGRLLYLGFDPAVVTPFNRFALARFSDDPAEALARAYQARVRARWASLALPAPLGAIAAALCPEDLVSGALGRASVGVLAALVFFAILRELFAWRTWGGPRSDRLRDTFEAELAARLALAPPPIERAPARMFARPTPARTRALANPPPPPPSFAIPRPAASAAPSDPGPRVAWPLFAAIAAAAGIVGVMAFLQRYAAPKTPPPAVELARTGIGAAVRSNRVDVREPPEPERCVCMRADSPLFEEGVPTLAILTWKGDDDASAPPVPALDRKGFPHFDFELAVVNDGARPLHDVRVTLTFARRNKEGKRVGAVDRGLFWGGVLAPGHAVKWHVKAPGSEMRVDASVNGTLEKSRLDPAPADAFFELTSSKYRAVRMHGAAMLAYLRDPRAETAARALSATSAADEAAVARIRRAAAPIIACDVRREPGRVEACIFNASSRPRGGLALREVLASPSDSPRRVPIAPPIPVHEGLRLSLDVPPDFAPEVAVVDAQTPE